jgi:hypothetical protein
MSTKICPSCDGNGYWYNTHVGEITGYCPKCNGEGLVDTNLFEPSVQNFRVELDVEVSGNAQFDESIVTAVQQLGWNHNDYPVQSDYLLQLLVNVFKELKATGIHAKSISVGKQIVYVNSIDVSTNQPTLF